MDKKSIWKMVIQTLISIMDKKSIWKMVIQTLISILSAIGTTLGLVSCMG